jgi:hypothetical protein
VTLVAVVLEVVAAAAQRQEPQELETDSIRVWLITALMEYPQGARRGQVPAAQVAMVTLC